METLKTRKTSFECHAMTNATALIFKTRPFAWVLFGLLIAGTLNASRELVSSIETERFEHEVSVSTPPTGSPTRNPIDGSPASDPSSPGISLTNVESPTGSPSKSVVDEFDPKIAWLASFPNSGTSFTLHMVGEATRMNFASNYENEFRMPIYEGHTEGPFTSEEANLPFGRYILTKTHCGGYCAKCPPEQYAYGYNRRRRKSKLGWTAKSGISFLKDCASGLAHGTGTSTFSRIFYPPERVSHVIHLIRNPFHNAVANFHHEINSGRENKTDNSDGMKKYCEELNNLWYDEEKEFFEGSFFFQNSTQSPEALLKPTFNSTFTNGKSWSEIIAMVPCRAIFFRYVQWHNLFHQAIDYAPHKPRVLTVHYENYQTNAFQDTAKLILEFLELKPVPRDDGKVYWLEFHPRTDYEPYFTMQEKEYIRAFLGTLASPQVWGEIQHYFDKINPIP